MQEFKDLKILVIDDDLAVCKFIYELCNIFEIKCKYTTNPEDISNILENENFDIIFLDQYLPGVEGLDIIKKGLFKNLNSYLVVMTGAILDQEMVNNMLKLGVNEFLKKPFDINSFKKILFRAKTYHHEITNFFRACKSLKKSEMEFLLDNDLSIISTVTRMLVRNVKELGFVENLKILETAIIEALTNSIIHGNLEISSSVKDVGFDKFSEEINKKLKDEKIKKRKVYVYSYLDKEKFIVKIKDEGKGFNWREIEKKLSKDLLSLYGRGIFIIKSIFDEVKWNDKGNEITLIKYPLSSSVKK